MIRKLPSLTLKGSHYRLPAVYDALTFLKLGPDRALRFKIASKFVSPRDSVVDICGGTGAFYRFLPDGCEYLCLDASHGLTRRLPAQGVNVRIGDATQALPSLGKTYDVAVMIISLCHFRGRILDQMLENLKSTAKKVVIVEETLAEKRSPGSLLQKTINFLSETEYYKPTGLFTKSEFKGVARKHGYRCASWGKRYDTALFEHKTASHENRNVTGRKAAKV